MKALNNLLDLSGKTSIVTGGASGIGFGIAARLGEAGANVVIADANKALADEAVAKLEASGGVALAISVDVSKEDEVDHMVEETVRVFGGIDILVNNAGIYPSMPVMSMDPALFDKVIAINLRGVYLATKKVGNVMIAQGRGGSIINITSIDALHPSMVGLAHYDASKHGAWGFTKNSALELAPHNIWVNAIAPGGIATPGVAALQKNDTAPAGEAVDSKKNIQEFMARIPMGRMGEPDDIAKVALFLASDMSSYMTGSQIVVDGGVLLK